MARILIKPSKSDEDLYVVWTTVADGPIKLGTQAHVLDKATLSSLFSHISVSMDDEAFITAAEHGSSYSDGTPAWFPWDTEEPLLFADETGDYYVYRDQFAGFIAAYMEWDNDNKREPDLPAKVQQFLVNLDDEEE